MFGQVGLCPVPVDPDNVRIESRVQKTTHDYLNSEPSQVNVRIESQVQKTTHDYLNSEPSQVM
jgi:hypothetical protein